MNVFAAIAGAAFGLAHLAAGLAVLNAPDAERGSGAPGAVPPAARYLWLAVAVLAVAGSVLFGVSATVPGLVLMAVGVVGVVALAIGNGVWMHGRPNWSHHVVRILAAAAVLALAAVSL